MSCGRCGKPILAQQGGSLCATCRSPAAQCSIWYVFFPSSNPLLFPWLLPISQMLIQNITNSHLPVKSMLFHCPVCSHGGHQACYRGFYTEMPLVLLPPPPRSPSPGSPLKLPHHPCRSTSRSKDGDYEDVTDIAVLGDPFDTATVTPAPRQLMGHACAAGCGHFCWIANFREDDEKP